MAEDDTKYHFPLMASAVFEPFVHVVNTGRGRALPSSTDFGLLHTGINRTFRRELATGTGLRDYPNCGLMRDWNDVEFDH